MERTGDYPGTNHGNEEEGLLDGHVIYVTEFWEKEER